jgi:hypothetical protein
MTQSDSLSGVLARVRITEDIIQDGARLIRFPGGPAIEVAVLHDGKPESVSQAGQPARLIASATRLQTLVGQAAIVWADEFEQDLPISGADLLDWFS